MRRETILIILSILIALTPFVGLPLSWRAWIIPILAAAILVIGYTLREQRLVREDNA